MDSVRGGEEKKREAKTDARARGEGVQTELSTFDDGAILSRARRSGEDMDMDMDMASGRHVEDENEDVDEDEDENENVGGMHMAAGEEDYSDIPLLEFALATVLSRN